MSSASRLRCHIAVLQVELDAYRAIYTIHKELRGDSGKRRRWKRKRLCEERQFLFGLYGQLMVELRHEDKKAC